MFCSHYAFDCNYPSDRKWLAAWLANTRFHTNPDGKSQGDFTRIVCYLKNFPWFLFGPQKTNMNIKNAIKNQQPNKLVFDNTWMGCECSNSSLSTKNWEPHWGSFAVAEESIWVSPLASSSAPGSLVKLQARCGKVAYLSPHLLHRTHLASGNSLGNRKFNLLRSDGGLKAAIAAWKAAAVMRRGMKLPPLLADRRKAVALYKWCSFTASTSWGRGGC